MEKKFKLVLKKGIESIARNKKKESKRKCYCFISLLFAYVSFMSPVWWSPQHKVKWKKWNARLQNEKKRQKDWRFSLRFPYQHLQYQSCSLICSLSCFRCFESCVFRFLGFWVYALQIKFIFSQNKRRQPTKKGKQMEKRKRTKSGRSWNNKMHNSQNHHAEFCAHKYWNGFPFVFLIASIVDCSVVISEDDKCEFDFTFAWTWAWISNTLLCLGNSWTRATEWCACCYMKNWFQYRKWSDSRNMKWSMEIIKKSIANVLRSEFLIE